MKFLQHPIRGWLMNDELESIVTFQSIVGLRNRGYATRFQASAGKQGFLCNMLR
jgi:hypothetical protein